MKNKISDLRNHLFAQLERLSDCNKSELETEIDRAASMIQVAETIIDSGRVEVEFLKITNESARTGSEFFRIDGDKKIDLKLTKEYEEPKVKPANGILKELEDLNKIRNSTPYEFVKDFKD